jgi:N-terminal 7TM region of histidine kinase
MSGPAISTLLAMAIQVALGLTVFFAHPKRRSNQCFFLLSLAICTWIGSLLLAFTAKQEPVAEFAIREASAAAALIFAAFNLLRLSISQRQKDWSHILARSCGWLLVTVAVVGLCQTKFFLQAARMPGPGHNLATPDYGPGVKLYVGFFVVGLFVLIASTWRDLRSTKGSERNELAYILIAGIVALVSAIPLALLLKSFFDPSRSVWLAPFRVVLFSAIVAYGVVTRKVMDVGILLRRSLSYGLLASYLLALYAIVWWLVVTALQSSVPSAHTIAHVTAAIVIAFAMAPARGVSQRLAERLFIGSNSLDFRATVSKAAKVLASVNDVARLARSFCIHRGRSGRHGSGFDFARGQAGLRATLSFCRTWIAFIPGTHT